MNNKLTNIKDKLEEIEKLNSSDPFGVWHTRLNSIIDELNTVIYGNTNDGDNLYSLEDVSSALDEFINSGILSDVASETDNIDNITENSVFVVPTSSLEKIGSDIVTPVKSLVITYGSDLYTYQMCLSDKIYTRYRNNDSSWMDWIVYLTKDYADATYVPIEGDNPIEIKTLMYIEGDLTVKNATFLDNAKFDNGISLVNSSCSFDIIHNDNTVDFTVKNEDSVINTPISISCDNGEAIIKGTAEYANHLTSNRI